MTAETVDGLWTNKWMDVQMEVCKSAYLLPPPTPFPPPPPPTHTHTHTPPHSTFLCCIQMFKKLNSVLYVLTEQINLSPLKVNQNQALIMCDMLLVKTEITILFILNLQHAR